MVFQLRTDYLAFPEPDLADPDGLLAIGGDLSLERLYLAYQHGIFPWFNEDDPILWYSPHERCVIFPHKIKVSKSLQRTINQGMFNVTVDNAFSEVIRSCAKIPRKGQEGTWIGKKMQDAYISLHDAGIAKSIEVWNGDRLIGGLYGVVIGRVFCGESMFSLESNASKIALVFLARHTPIDLIDCQIPNDHLMSMGAEMISRSTFMEIMDSSIQ
ncbi:MAG: leucyl/phenylalanyl-tRNA--protein transferase [Pedobacter sp.]|nr:MAG: leucyl/phenylalanyl-tRNA--protein transferase [Pedobacter sp.]